MPDYGRKAVPLQKQKECKKADGADRIKTAWFTKPGDKTKAPFIIAVPTTQMWTAEGADFPIGTFTELE